MSDIKYTNRQLTHVAISSWSGYIYQGLMAILRSVTLIAKKGESCYGYALCIERDEDFSIRNEDGMIVSLHQCKLYKNQNDFSNEFEKMQAKLEMHKQKGDCVDNCKMYFHTNLQGVTPTNGVELYKYPNNTNYCDQRGIEKHLRDLIEKIAKDKGVATCADIAYCRLCVIVENTVRAIHQEAIDTKKKENGIIDKYDIPFGEICKVVCYNSMDNVMSDEELASFVRISLFTSFDWQIKFYQDELDDKKQSKIYVFLSKVKDLDDNMFLDLMGRLTPQYEFSTKIESLRNICSDERFEVLFEVITEVNEPLNEKELNWTSDEKFFTPSTVSGKPKIIARHILDNPNVTELLREYDWIVGKPDVSMAEIDSSRITTVERKPEDAKNILSTKRTGILTIKDKNDGHYPTSN